ncbi:MAG: FAD binding domain-containing protein [Actinomycetota bacterium]|nr:FAD binding domain-containing protein [Actinomycetota bacterium]
MKPSQFQHHAPEQIDEVVGLLAEYGDDAKVLAGGQSLIPMMALRMAAYPHLVDIARVASLSTISASAGAVRVGAMVRQSRAERDASVAKVPLLAKAIPHIGHFQIRSRGTVGGSIAHADPASELPAVALALDARIEATGPGGVRHIDASEFFLSTWQTALDDGEILSAVEFPLWGANSGFAVEEIARRKGDFALIGALAGVTLDGARVARACITMIGVGSTPIRCHDAEAALIAGGADTDLDDIGRIAAAPLTPADDVHASAEYRQHVSPAIVRRALTAALKEARS